MVNSNNHENSKNNHDQNKRSDNVSEIDETPLSLTRTSEAHDEENSNGQDDSNPKPKLRGMKWVRTFIWNFIQTLGNAIITCLRIVRNSFNYTNISDTKLSPNLKNTWLFSAICQAIVAIVLNLAKAIFFLFGSIAHLCISIIHAMSIIIKGIVIAAAALIIETKIAPKAIKGISIAISIFNISIATGIGTLLDGLNASKNSFFNAIKTIFGYQVIHTKNEEKDNYSDDAIYDKNYYKNTATAGAQYFTHYMQNCGTDFLAFYEKERDSILPTSAENDFMLEDENNSQIDSDTKTQRRNSSSSIEI